MKPKENLQKCYFLLAGFPVSLAEERKRDIKVWGNDQSRI